MSDFWFIPASSSRSEQLQKTEGEQFFSGTKRSSPFFLPGKNPGVVQAKLNIGSSDDRLEKEADLMADNVVQRKAFLNNQPPPFFRIGRQHSVQRKCGACAEEDKKSENENDETAEDSIAARQREENHPESTIQAKCAACEQEELQAKSTDNGRAPADPVEHQLHSKKTAGESLPLDLQEEMNTSFGADFSKVRVHTGNDASGMNKQLHAQAFTHGNDIYFNDGKYSPGSGEGKKLLAHELTHTIQQGQSPLLNGSATSNGAKGTVQKKEEHDCDKDKKKEGSKEEAKANETTSDKGHCIVTNKPVEQPPKDKEKPKEEEQPASVEANPGAGVDERQSHAPPAEQNAPGREENVQEGAGEQKGGPCDMPAAPAGKGAAAAGGGNAATPAPAAGQASAQAATTTAPAEGDGPQKDKAEDGKQPAGKGGKGKPAENETGFLQTIAAKGISPLINPGGLGEAASPELQGQRDQVMLAEQTAEAQLHAKDNSVIPLTSQGIKFLRPAQKQPSPSLLKDHDRSTLLANSFLSGTGRRLHEFIEQGRGTAANFRQQRIDARVMLENEITGRKNEARGVFAQLRASASAKADTALQQVENRYKQTVAQVEVKFILSNLALMVSKMVAQPQMQEALTTQLTKLDEVYTTGHAKLVNSGKEMGRDAEGRAAKHAESYMKAEGASPDVQEKVRKRKKDGFWDGYLTYNRYKARANSAKEVGKQYKEGMEKQAKSQADDMLCGKKTDVEVVNLIAAKGVETIQCTYDNAVKAVKRQRDAALMQALDARQKLTAAIKDSVKATEVQLREKEAAQLQLINDYGIRQAMAIERDTAAAINSFVTGVSEAAGKVLEVLSAFVSESAAMEAPPPAALEDQLRGMQGQINTALGQASGALNNSAAGTQAHVDETTGQSKSALGQLCEQGLADAYALSGSFNASIESLNANGQSTYDTLWTTVSQAIDGETTNGTKQIASIVTAISGLYTKLNAGLTQRFNDSDAAMRKGMQQSLNDDFDKKICTEAEKAAADVQPWWKTVLKILLIIVVIAIVIVVAGPAIIAAVGGLAASAAGALGAGAALAGTIGAWVGAVVGGAIVGAISGAVIQVGNNLIDAIGNGPLTWDKVTKGVWGAIVAGAIGGALGGLGGKFAQLLVGRLSSAGISAAYQTVARYGIELAFDAVGSVLGDLANGNPITLEGIVKGAIIGIIVQRSMGGLSRHAKAGQLSGASGRQASRLERLAMGIERLQGAAAARGEAFGARTGSRLGGKGVEWTGEALKTAREAEVPREAETERLAAGEEQTAGKPKAAEADEPTTGGRQQAEPEGNAAGRQKDADAQADEAAAKAANEPDAAVKTKEGEGSVRGEQELPGGHKQQIDENFDVKGCSDCDLLKRRYRALRDKGLVSEELPDAEFEGIMKEFDQVKQEFLGRYGEEILQPPTAANRGELIQGRTRQQIFDEYLQRVNGIEAKLLPHIDVRRLLIVGDSTFEYVRSLQQKLAAAGRSPELTGTGIEGRAEAAEIAGKAGVDLPPAGRTVPESGPAVTIEHGVDARQLAKQYPPDSFDRVIFNNPEIPGDEAAIGKMLNDVLGSAPAVLKPGGEVHIGVTGSRQAKGLPTLESHLTRGTIEINGRRYQVTEIARPDYEYAADYPARRTEGGRLRTSKGPKRYFIFKLLP